MLTSQRKQLLLQRLKQDGQIVAKQLSREWGTSEDTIRRDLRELAREGLLQRVHGGAMPFSAAVADFQKRESVSIEEKAQLGRLGAKLIQPGQVVLIDGGTTCTQLVRALPLDLCATVITHSPSIAAELAAHERIEVIVLGGRVYRHSMVCVGASTIAAANSIRADIYFMGATGVHAVEGLSTGDFEEANLKRALHARAADTMVLASPEKIGAVSNFHIVPAAEISCLMVSASSPSGREAEWSPRGVQVVRG